MKLFIVIYMFLGAYTASFIRDLPQHTAAEKAILAAVTVVLFALAALPLWLRKRRDGALRRDSFLWPALTYGMYFLGLGLMWLYSANPDPAPSP